MTDEYRPWERLEDESPKAYYAFIRYCEMGPERSLEKLADKIEKSRSLLSRWSAPHRWVERSFAYGKHFNDIKMKEREQNVIEDVKRLADITSTFTDILEEAIQALRPEEIKVSDIPRFLKAVLPLEWELRKFQLELEEKEKQSRQREQMNFKVEILRPDEIRERLKEERENRSL